MTVQARTQVLTVNTCLWRLSEINCPPWTVQTALRWENSHLMRCRKRQLKARINCVKTQLRTLIHLVANALAHHALSQSKSPRQYPRQGPCSHCALRGRPLPLGRQRKSKGRRLAKGPRNLPESANQPNPRLEHLPAVGHLAPERGVWREDRQGFEGAPVRIGEHHF